MSLTRLFHAKLAIVNASNSQSGLRSIGQRIRLASRGRFALSNMTTRFITNEAGMRAERKFP